MSRRRNAYLRMQRKPVSPAWEPSAWLRGQIAQALALSSPRLVDYEAIIIPLWREHCLTDEEEFTCDRCRQSCGCIGSGVLQHGDIFIAFGFCKPCIAIEDIPADVITWRPRP